MRLLVHLNVVSVGVGVSGGDGDRGRFFAATTERRRQCHWWALQTRELSKHKQRCSPHLPRGHARRRVNAVLPMWVVILRRASHIYKIHHTNLDVDQP